MSSTFTRKSILTSSKLQPPIFTYLSCTWRSEGNLQALVLSFHRVQPGDTIRVFRRGSRHLYLLYQLTSRQIQLSALWGPRLLWRSVDVLNTPEGADGDKMVFDVYDRYRCGFSTWQDLEPPKA